VSVADAFDAMTSARPYRPGLPVSRALQELETGKGIQFDARVVDAFRTAFPEVAALPIPTPEPRPLRLPARAVDARRA